jgi:CRISPR-associated protein Cas1
MEGPVRGNVLLRKAQYTAAGDGARASQLAYWFVVCKIANSRNVLLRAAREHSDPDGTAALRKAADGLAAIVASLSPDAGVDTLRGLEGSAAYIYFAAFDSMIRANREDFFFRGRSKRPPLDNMNAIMSFLYALLANDVRSALEAVGLDPAMGFLHALRPGRPSLALDLMEELRAWLCDRLALSLVNLRQLQGKDFETTPTGVHLNDKARRELIAAWQKRKREEVEHPFLEERVPIGLIPFAQAQLLARHLRGDLDCYPPFHWK